MSMNSIWILYLFIHLNEVHMLSGVHLTQYSVTCSCEASYIYRQGQTKFYLENRGEVHNNKLQCTRVALFFLDFDLIHMQKVNKTKFTAKGHNCECCLAFVCPLYCTMSPAHKLERLCGCLLVCRGMSCTAQCLKMWQRDRQTYSLERPCACLSVCKVMSCTTLCPKIWYESYTF